MRNPPDTPSRDSVEEDPLRLLAQEPDRQVRPALRRVQARRLPVLLGPRRGQRGIRRLQRRALDHVMGATMGTYTDEREDN